MSSIGFHSQYGRSARVSGRERAWFGLMVDNIHMAMLDLTRPRGAPKTAWTMDMREKEFQQVLNTSLALGGPALRLAAYIHGTCEIHGWIAGADRRWASDVIREGCNLGVFRLDRAGYGGWQWITEWLLIGAGDVVMDYSVTDNWLSRVPEGLEVTDEAWWSLDADARWEASISALKCIQPSAKEVVASKTSEAWSTFGNGLCALSNCPLPGSQTAEKTNSGIV